MTNGAKSPDGKNKLKISLSRADVEAIMEKLEQNPEKWMKIGITEAKLASFKGNYRGFLLRFVSEE